MSTTESPNAATARQILDQLEATYQSTHRYEPAALRDFPYLNHRFYDSTASALERAGFRQLADLENKTVSEVPGTVIRPTVVRTLCSRDGAIQVALYDVRLRSWWLRALLWVLRKSPRPVVDMETELTDGSFVVTTNAAMAAALELPALVDAESLPAGTPAATVFDRHRVRVSAQLRDRPGVTARPVTTSDDLIASQHRLEAIKAAHRGEIGLITRAELEKLAVFGRRQAAGVYDAVVEERLRRAS